MASAQRNNVVGWLLERAYGHGQAVAVPGARPDHGTSSLGVKGPYPPGVQETIAELVNAWSQPNSGPLNWAFLIGAPGNGKSEALGELAKGLGAPLPVRRQGEPAPRLVELPTPSGRARLVNDASIPHEGCRLGGSLLRDIRQSAEAHLPLLANVNRGVLIEEKSLIEAGTLGATLVDWLLDVAAGKGGDPARAYYCQKTLNLESGRQLLVHAVVLDAASLFEPMPGRGAGAVQFDKTPVRVEPYAPCGTVGVRGVRANSIAGSLLEQLCAQAEWEGGSCARCAATNLCPLLANAQWLRHQELRGRFLDLCRAAEVASARRMTYRDLLGHLSLAFIGHPEPAWTESLHPCDWVRMIAAISDGYSVATLAGHRIYAALFPPPTPTDSWTQRGAGGLAKSDIYRSVVEGFGVAEQGVRSSTFAPAFRALDPARDTEGWGGTRGKVVHTLEAIATDQACAALERVGVLPTDAIAQIDRHLDDAFLKGLVAVGASTNRQRTIRERVAQLKKWRAILAIRQTGLALGRFANREAVQAWLSAQSSVLAGDDGGKLARGLQNVMLPRGDTLTLAPFRPRTRPIEGDLPPNTLLVRRVASELSIELRPAKDGLAAVVLQRDSADPVAWVPVDLALAREALNQDGKGGFTDIPEQVLSRVERARASLVSHTALRRARGILITDKVGKAFAVHGEIGSLVVDEAYE